MTSTHYYTETITSVIIKFVPCSSPIATLGTSTTLYSTSLTTTTSTTIITQTSTAYEVIYPSTTGLGLAPTGGSGTGSGSGFGSGSGNNGMKNYPSAGGIPGSPSNGCPAVQTVTSTLPAVTVTVTTTATVTAAGSPSPSNGPFSTTSGAAPFPLPSGSGNPGPLPSGTSAPKEYEHHPKGTGHYSEGYVKPTGWPTMMGW